MPPSLRTFFFLAGLLAMFCSPHVKAQQLQIEYALGATPTSFSKFTVGESLGFLDQPVWFRFDLSELDTLQSNVLLIRPVHIDRIDVFSGHDLVLPVLTAGDTVYSSKGLISDGYSFVLDDRWKDEMLYVRLESRNLIQPYFNIQPIEDAIQLSKVVILTIGGIVALALGCLAWTLSAAVASPNLIAGIFALRLVMFIFTLGIHSGVLRDVLSPALLPPQDSMHNISALAYISVAHFFDWLLLKSVVKSVFARVFLGLVLAFSIVKFGVFVSGSVSDALLINNVSALAVLLFGSCCAVAFLFSQARSQTLELKLVSAYFTVQFVPLIALFFLSVTNSAQYLFAFDLMFFSYAIVPGGIVVWLIYTRQKADKDAAQRAHLNAELMRQKSEEELAKRREIEDLFSMLTHEIRTPLASLQMAAALGELDKQLVDSSAQSIANVLREADRAEDLELGGLRVTLCPVSLRDVIEEASCELDLPVCYENDIGPVNADPGFLRILVDNLLVNAKKYGLPNQPIQVECTQSGGQAIVRITNQIDVVPGDLDMLFEKYKRGSNTRSEPGSGVGLFIARALGSKMDATLSASVENKAFTLTLVIPLAVDSLSAAKDR